MQQYHPSCEPSTGRATMEWGPPMDLELNRRFFSFDRHLREILDHFDFHRVAMVMKIIQWTWGMDEGSHYPSAEELKVEATRLLWGCYCEPGERACISCGGLYAEREGDQLRLYFALEDEDTTYLESDENGEHE